jgi:hypothetical protein
MYKVFLVLGKFPLVDVDGVTPFRVTAKSLTAYRNASFAIAPACKVFPAVILTAVVVVGVLTVSSAKPPVTLPKFIHSENAATELKEPHLGVEVNPEPSANTVPSSCRYHELNALPVMLATSAARVTVAVVVGIYEDTKAAMVL